jgi:hypothetical protein
VLSVAAWLLLNQLGSEILLQFPYVISRREAGFDYPDIWHSPIPEWQLPEICWQIIYFICNLLTQGKKRCLNNCLTFVFFPENGTFKLVPIFIVPYSPAFRPLGSTWLDYYDLKSCFVPPLLILT